MSSIDPIYTEPLYSKDISDGREVSVWLRFCNTIVIIGPKGSDGYDDQW